MNVTRRGFLKGTGATAGAMVITSAIPLPAWADDANGIILTAGRWGAMNVEVKDGKVISSKGHWLKLFLTVCKRPRPTSFILRLGLNTRWYVKAF